MTPLELRSFIRVLTTPRARAVLDGVPIPGGANYWDVDAQRLRNLGNRLALPIGGVWLPNSDDLMQLIEEATTRQKWPFVLARFASWINLQSGNAPSVLAGCMQEALLLFLIDVVSGRIIDHEQRLLN